MLALSRFSLVVAVISIVSLCLRRGDADIQVLPSNTTVVILNWSRPFNVYKIASEICKNIEEHAVPSILIWNNSHKRMSFAVCLPSMVNRTVCAYGLRTSQMGPVPNLEFTLSTQKRIYIFRRGIWPVL